MSTTPWTLIDTGAAPFTGTAAHSLLGAPADDITARDPDDELNAEIVAAVLNQTNDGQSLHLDLVLGGEVARRDTFLSIGSDLDFRILRCNYKIFVTDATHALVLANPSLSATSQNGNDIRHRHIAEQQVAFDISGPITIDFQVTLSAADAVNYVCTPIRAQGYNVFPTDASGAVISVNGQDGVVVLDAADVGAVSADLLGFAVLESESDPRPDTDHRVLFDTGATQPTIGGSVFPGDLWLTETVIP